MGFGIIVILTAPTTRKHFNSDLSAGIICVLLQRSLPLYLGVCLSHVETYEGRCTSLDSHLLWREWNV